MEIILSILVPGLLLAYYLKTNRQILQHNRILAGTLIGGTILFYTGLAFRGTAPAVESLLKLGGACLFFTGVAFLTVRRPQENDPDRRRDHDEDKG